MASFPSWRRCLGSLAGGGHLLSSDSFYFCACLRFIPSASAGSHLVVGCSLLADALSPFQTGGCFVAVVALVQVASGGCFAVVVVCSGGCFATFFLGRAPWTLWFLLAGSVVGFWLEEWVLSFVFFVLLCCCSCCRCVFSFVCTFFQCFSIFSSLCSCVGQTLFGRIKIVSVTASFLMKNVLRHDREKKSCT